jgi:uncharacterized protein
MLALMVDTLPRPMAVLVALILLLTGCGAGEPLPSPTSTEPGPAAPTQPADNGTADDGTARDGTADGTGAAGTVRVEPLPDDEGSPPVPSDPGPLPESEVRLIGPDGERLEVRVELAADPRARRRGLMLRPEVAEGGGMLFLFPEDSTGGFWMRNTLAPLDIAYVAEGGDVVEVMTMVPCEDDPCPSYTPSGGYRYALEVAAGVLTEAGVDATWRLELPDDLPDAS